MGLFAAQKSGVHSRFVACVGRRQESTTGDIGRSYLVARSLRHIRRSTMPCLPASRKSNVAGPSRAVVLSGANFAGKFGLRRVEAAVPPRRARPSDARNAA